VATERATRGHALDDRDAGRRSGNTQLRARSLAQPHLVEAAKSRQTLETIMAHILHLQQMSRRTLDGVNATIRAIVRAVAAEHTLALRAATTAASPRQSLAEVRAMYVPSLEPHQESDVVAQSTRSAS
jgi:hypothetical protein